MWKQRGLLIIVLALLLAGTGPAVWAQGDPEPDFTVDWCVIVNGQQQLDGLLADLPFIPADQVTALLRADISEPGVYDVTVPVLVGGVSSFADLFNMGPGGFSSLQFEDRTLVIAVRDSGINCATGDPYGVVRLWDDRVTMVIYRNVNYDMAFYFPNGRHVHTTPFWMLVGPFEANQLIDEHETIGGTLRLYYLYDGFFQMNWYGPDGSLALEIPFTYPEPCVDAPPREARVCDR